LLDVDVAPVVREETGERVWGGGDHARSQNPTTVWEKALSIQAEVADSDSVSLGSNPSSPANEVKKRATGPLKG